MTVAVFVAKIATPFLSEWLNHLLYGTKKKNNSDVDFDLMVEQKKSQLRSGLTSKKATHSGASGKTKASAFEKRVFERFQELSAIKNKKSGEHRELEELKQLMALFDQQQWGGGEQFKGMASQLSKVLQIPITPEFTAQLFKSALKSNILQRKSGRSLATMAQIKQLLTILAALHHFKDNELFRARLTKLEQTTQLQAYHSLYYLYLQAKGHSPAQCLKRMNITQKGLIDLPKDLELTVALDKKQHFIEFSDLKTQLTDKLNIMSSLAPLPRPKDKNDVETALKIFGLKTMTKMDVLKKRHRKLAMERHPDKLGAKGLPAQLERQITENFAMIQLAYEILAQHTK